MPRIALVWCGTARLVLARQVCYIICIAPAECVCGKEAAACLGQIQANTNKAHAHTDAERTCHGGKMAAERQQRQGDADIKSKNKERRRINKKCKEASSLAQN